MLFSQRVAVALLVTGLPFSAFSQDMPWETGSTDDAAEPAATEPVTEGAAPAEEAEDATEETDQGSEVEIAPGVSATAVVPSEEEAEDEGDPRLVSAMLNLEGSVGLQNLSSAWGGAPHTYRIALMSQFYTGSNTIRFNDTNDFFAGNLLIEASPFKYFSANLRLRFQSNVNSFGRPEAMLSQGDAALGLKGYFDVAPGFYLGLDSTFFVPTGFGSTGVDFSGFGIRPRLLVSMKGSELSDDQMHLNAHLNIGYRMDGSENLVPDGLTPTRVERFAYQLSAYDAVEIGTGIEYEFPYVSPFLAWSMSIPVSGADGVCDQPNLPCVSDLGFPAFPNVLSVGVKSEPIENLGLHAGVDVGLTSEDAAGLPVTLPWELVVGVQWTIDPTPKIEYVERESRTPEAAPVAWVAGSLRDQESGEPISGAIVRYPLGGETAQATAADGKFRSYEFMPGSRVTFAIEHPDYEPIEVERTLPGEPGEHPLAVQMKALPKAGTVRGDVRDEAGNPIAGASVRFTGSEEKEIPVGAAGDYAQELKPGKYSVGVTAPGFLSRGRDIEVVGDKTLELMFVLSPAPKEDLVELRDDKIEIRQTIYFDNGEATIQQRSFPLLQQVTSLLVENPQIKKVQIEGHTDDVGPDDFNLDLSKRRAQAVRQHLIDQGISSERLTAEGYGENRPILPNTSNRNRSINRRVEFRLQQ